MSTVWINGSSGFLGKKFLNFLPTYFKNIVEFRRSSIIHNDSFKINKEQLPSIEKPTLLINLVTHFELFPKDTAEIKKIFDANYFFGVDCVDSYLNFGGCKVINFSSYFQLLPSNLQSHYSLSKNCYLKYLESLDIDLFNFYIFDTFGKDDNRNKILDRMIANALKNEAIHVPANAIINLSEAQDIINTTIKVVTAKSPDNYTIFNEDTILLSDLAKLVIETLNSASSIVIDKEQENYIKLCDMENVVFFPMNRRSNYEKLTNYIKTFTK